MNPSNINQTSDQQMLINQLLLNYKYQLMMTELNCRLNPPTDSNQTYRNNPLFYSTMQPFETNPSKQSSNMELPQKYSDFQMKVDSNLSSFNPLANFNVTLEKVFKNIINF